MKGKIFTIFICAAIVLLSGISIAYYNTKTLGFDENAKIFSSDNKKISFLDFNIYYKDVKEITEQLNKYIPENQIPI